MHALEGIKVLDMSRTLAGPFASMMLGDLGADVIKIEQPGTGDETRRFTPPTWNGERCYYLSSNRNKRSVTIDLKSAEGKDAVYRLVKDADIFIENYRTGTMERLGYGYEQLKEMNQGLIYVSISGFGRTGPEKDRAGYDLLLQGFSGLMSMTGETGGPPVKAGTSIADLTTGLYAAFSTMTALFAREKTGKGQLIDVSMLDCQVAFLNYHGTNFFATGHSAGRLGSGHGTIVPYQAFSAKDGYVILAVPNQGLWEKCCKGFGWNDLLEDGRFASNDLRVANREILVGIINDRFSLLDSSEIFKEMDALGVPCGPIQTIEEVMNHPQVLAREMLLDISHPNAGGIKVPAFPVKFSETPAVLQRHPPLLGEHTVEVLKEIGLSDEQIEKMKEKKLI